MPNLNEFLGKNSEKQINTTFEKLNGVRPCSQCEEDVVGGLWDPENLIMKWTCSSGHENIYKVG